MGRTLRELFHREEGRLTLLGMFLVGCLATLGYTLFNIQVVQSANFDASQEKQSMRVVELPALRGRIFDRNHKCLVDNRPTFNAVLYFEELHDAMRERIRQEIRLHGKHIDSAKREQLLISLVHDRAEAFGRLIGRRPQLDDRTIRVHNIEQRPLPFVLFPDLTETELAIAKEHSPLPPGLDIQINALREYREKTSAAHTLGYVTRDRPTLEENLGRPTYLMPDIHGVSGIELKFDSVLRGECGSRTIRVNAGGYKDRELGYQPPRHGHDIVLALDLKAQQAAEEALGEHPGAVVLLDPNNGDVLAVASNPSFDPNQFVPTIRREDLSALQNDPLKPLSNRAFAEHFAPGSTFKLIVALAGLECGKITAASTSTCTGQVEIGGQVKRCWIKSKGGQHGTVHLREAIKHSCNIFFYEHGVATGMDAIVAMAKQFHLGEKTGIDTPREAPGHLPKPGRHFRAAETANAAIGQGEVDTTPLQMATVVAAIANGGRVVAPRLVLSVHQPSSEEPLGASVWEPPLTDRGHINVTPEHLNAVRQGMWAVVNDPDGTGKKASVPGFVIAGKTGTAQVMDEHNNIIGHRAWFVSYAPFDQPKYALAIMLEDGDSGGQTAAPIASKIYASLFGVESPASKTAVKKATRLTSAQIPATGAAAMAKSKRGGL